MDIKNITRVYKNSIGNALVKRNIPHFRLIKDSSIFQVGLGCKQRRFVYDDINSSAARKICNNKVYTKYFLTQLEVPVPKGKRLHAVEDLENAFSELTKPVVIKPISEMWGKGISTNIMTLQEAKKAYAIASKFKGAYVIMEEHVMGDDHRLLYIGGKYVAGLKRIPPVIIGNGNDPIGELIRKENEKRKKSRKIVKEILVDDTVISFLKKQGFSMDSILAKGQAVKIRMTGNISSGGTSENITDKIHPSIIELGREIISYLNLEIGGVDVLTTDIGKPLSETNGRVSEINQNPDIVMHTKPYFGKPLDTAGLFIEHLFPKTEDAWIKIEKRDGSRIFSQKELNKNLGKIPRKVIMIDKQSGKKKSIQKPEKPLFNYLISDSTFSIKL